MQGKEQSLTAYDYNEYGEYKVTSICSVCVIESVPIHRTFYTQTRTQSPFLSLSIIVTRSICLQSFSLYKSFFDFVPLDSPLTIGVYKTFHL